MRERVVAARTRQLERHTTTGPARLNSQLSSRELRRHCELDDASAKLLQTSVEQLGLSARAHDKVLRVARTIADLAEATTISPDHVSEAVNYRLLDRKLWT